VLEKRCRGRVQVWIPPPQALPPNFVSVHGPLPHPIVRIFYACGYICIITTGFILISPIIVPVGFALQTAQLLERLAARAKPQLLLAIDDAIWLLELQIWFLGKVIEEHTKPENLAARLVLSGCITLTAISDAHDHTLQESPRDPAQALGGNIRRPVLSLSTLRRVDIRTSASGLYQ
jgi:hypothetical protein